MRCVFVLDIFNGAVVHALRGERSRYEAIEKHSKIVSSSDPLEILRDIHPKEVYIADLNRLTGCGENLAIIEEISGRAKTMADIGILKASDLRLLSGMVTPILGTETAPFDLMAKAALQRKIVVSLDLKHGEILSRDPDLAAQEPLQFLSHLNDLSLQAVIILELDRVGTSAGLDSRFLEEAAAVSEHPLIMGGGVKGIEDLKTLEDLGFSGALVATAVHNGTIPVEMVR